MKFKTATIPPKIAIRKESGEFTGNPIITMIYGAVVGVLVATSFR